MIKNYHKYTEYSRYVDFKRLDFIVQSIRNHFSRTKIKGLDLGCGKGNVTVPLAYLGYSMTGIDISPDNIEVAKAKQITEDNPTFLVADAENLSLKEKSFDFVVCTEVFEHLKHPKNALNLINKILKENGLLVATVPNGYGIYSLLFDHFRNKVVSKIFPKIELSDHVQAFTLPRISNLLNETGFEILNINHSDFISFLHILVKSTKFSYYDCKLADKLPPPLVSGYYIACGKR
jgi:ubiquinone biosynthesis O-methyltransferase